MAVVASEMVECVKYSATHTVTFKEMTPFFELEEEWMSSPFSSAADPTAGKFQIGLDFMKDHGDDKYGILSHISRKSSRGQMPFHTCKISVDVNPEASIKGIKHKHSPDKTSITPDLDHAPDDFRGVGIIALLDVPETLTIKHEVVYFSAPVNVKNAAIPRTDPNLHDDLLKLFADTESVDGKVTIFMGGGRRFSVHKDLLRARSEYFKTMFGSGMKEGLLPLADRFGVTTLKSMCATSIANSLDSTNVIRALLLADAHNVPDLVEKCMPIIRQDVKALKATKDWQELKNNPDVLALVLEFDFGGS